MSFGPRQSVRALIACLFILFFAIPPEALAQNHVVSPADLQKEMANATQARTMEHYRRLGFAEEIRAQGLPPDYPTDIAYFSRYTKYELARFSLPSARQAREIVKTLTGSWSAAELPHRV